MSVLELRHLETLVAVVEEGSVTDAADRLLVSQSAVSHRLAEAERRLGHALFERRPRRGLRPTPAARVLVQAAQRTLPALARAESDFLRAAGEPVDVVRIGVASYECFHWLAAFHERVRAELPEVVLELVVVGNEPAPRLAEGAVDVVLAPGPAAASFDPRASFADQPLFTDELVLVTHPEHPAAARDRIEPEALADETYLTYSPTPAPGFEYERFLRPTAVAPRSLVVIEQTGAIAAMVASGLGVSILSRWALSPWIEAGSVAAVRCGEDGLPLEWRALLRAPATPDAPDARIAVTLADWLRDHA